ncbi:MAG: hypothetical protein HYS80_02365 [Candidatus Aenigmarchaeota archaeon]|nr:hypothetical protein [Candidatus Aenigmarchaeota archaeon]
MVKISVIADTEGVVVNTFDDHLVPIYNYVRGKKGLPQLTAEDYRSRVRASWIDTLRELGIDDEEEQHPSYLPILKSASRHLKIIAEEFDLYKHFSAIISAGASEFIDRSLESAQTEQPITTGIVIDDQSENLEIAKLYGKNKNVQILTIGVTYGFYSPERIVAVHPDKLAHTPAEVVESLREFEEALRAEGKLI